MTDHYGTHTAFGLHLKNIRKAGFQFLEEEEERELFRKYQESGKVKYRDRLFESHIGLVIKIAKRWKYSNIHIENFISEGNLGLLRAIKVFDPSRGVRFSVCAQLWIRSFMLEYSRKNQSIVHVPLKNSLSKKSLPLIFVMSLSTAVSGEGKGKPRTIDELPDFFEFFIDETPTQDISTEWKQELERTMSAMKTLDRRERSILSDRKLRDTPVMLKEVGHKYGISGERVRQIEMGALEKIKKTLKDKKEFCFV